ncbi:hypothetical protein KY284_022311 [Solanum tuberosum]|nr:hypothetical protein KY284_022311 [Solanum tuberosum]
MDTTHDNWKTVEENLNSFFGYGLLRKFVKARNNKRSEVVAEEYLEELIDQSLILTGKQMANGRMKTCIIHDFLHQLLSEAHTKYVVHIMNGNVTVTSEAIDDQRRVIFPLEIQEKQFKFLKVLDVLSIEYNFSCVIPQLEHLKYVAARFKGVVSLAKLRNLARAEEAKLKYPLDIWTMTEIRHLDIDWL